VNGISRVHLMFWIAKDVVIPYNTILTPFKIDPKKRIDQPVGFNDAMAAFHNPDG